MKHIFTEQRQDFNYKLSLTVWCICSFLFGNVKTYSYLRKKITLNYSKYIDENPTQKSLINLLPTKYEIIL
jgi:hypothetical protein